MQIIENLYEFLKNIILNMKSEYVALFSVVVTIIIFILNKQAELRYKKYEERKHEYKKLIDFLNLTYTEPNKMKSPQNGKPSSEMQQKFFDVGSSLMLYASKKLYKKYIFFRDYTTHDAFKKSRYYDDALITYIIADILKQIRKEIGLANFNSITSNEALAFFINNVGTIPIEKNKAQKMNYKIKMLKVELFFMDRLYGVLSHTIFYNLIKPIFGIIRCLCLYFLIIPFMKLIKFCKK